MHIYKYLAIYVYIEKQICLRLGLIKLNLLFIHVLSVITFVAVVAVAEL